MCTWDWAGKPGGGAQAPYRPLPKPKPKPKPARSRTVFFFGGSTTFGGGSSSRDKKWVEVFRRRFHERTGSYVTAINRARGGTGAGGGSLRLGSARG